MSVNPNEIIKKVEFGTSPLKNRILAINKLVDAKYPVGILIAPVILIDNWEFVYEELIIYLRENLSKVAKENIFLKLFL